MRLFWSKKRSMLLSELIEDFLLEITVNKSPATVRNYKWRLGRWLEYLGDKKVGELRKADLQRFVVNLREAGNLKDASINGIIQAVKAFTAWLLEEGYIDKPLHQAISRRKPQDQAEDKATDAITVQLMIKNTRHFRDELLFVFMADTGARRGEVSTLTISNIYWDKLKALVYGKVGPRIVTFNRYTADMMRKYIKEHRPDVEHDFLFCGVNKPHRPLHPQAITAVCLRIRDRLKKEDCEIGNTNPHSFRHWVCQTYNEHGDVYLAKQKLGHKKLESTLGYLRDDLSAVQAEDRAASTLNALGLLNNTT